ncbi:hypothetical protein Hanom_Chr07g00621121 [Helianthus anomalus]
MINILNGPPMVIVLVTSRRFSDVEHLFGLRSKYDLIFFVPFILCVDTRYIVIICNTPMSIKPLAPEKYS